MAIVVAHFESWGWGLVCSLLRLETSLTLVREAAVLSSHAHLALSPSAVFLPHPPFLPSDFG